MIFYKVKLYSDLILHVVYVVLQVYGWYYWLHGGQNREAVLVTKLTLLEMTLWGLLALIGTVLWGGFMSCFTNAAVPYGDAFTTASSLIAQWLMVKKKLHSWVFWILVDLVAIGIYWSKDLRLTAGLYFLFLFLAILGFYSWKKTLVQQQIAGT